jgi:hypothetical protein
MKGRSRMGTFVSNGKPGAIACGQSSLRRRVHQPIPEQGQWLAEVVREFFDYHAVPTDFPAIRASTNPLSASGCARYGDAANRIAASAAR